MIEISVPGWKDLALEHLVLDMNGTLAVDGTVLSGVFPRLEALARSLSVSVVTADTFGNAAAQFAETPWRVHVLAPGDQARAKGDYVASLGADRVVAVGNGRNDSLMLKDAALGIAVLMEEGASVEALSSADAVVRHINDALDLLLNPKRLIATLRV